MIRILKKNLLLILVVAASFVLIAASLIWNYAYLLKPEYRIAQSVYRLMECGGAAARFHISSSAGQNGGDDSDPLLQLIAGSMALEGGLLYNSSQNVLSIDGNASLAGEEIMPLDFYLTIGPDVKEKIAEADFREVLRKLPEIERKKENKRLKIGRVELPVFVDSYHMEMNGKEFAGLFGQFGGLSNSMPQEMLEKTSLGMDILVDRDCYCRGLNLTVRYENMEIACDLTVDDIVTSGRMDEIPTDGRKDLSRMDQDDWLQLISESIL